MLVISGCRLWTSEALMPLKAAYAIYGSNNHMLHETHGR